MNLYDEFFSIMSFFNKLGIRYAVVGGIALAFHGKPRFTRDIDILIHQDDMDLLLMVMDRSGYQETAEPWTFPNTALTLRRFLKVEGEDEMMMDVLLAGADEHFRIIENAVSAESSIGMIPVAAKRDIIRMKRFRDSDQDRVDISELERDDED